MKKFLVLKLQGVLQAWGGHTYEDLRHTELVPTRSGVLGLLAACLGVDRNDIKGLEALASSVKIAVRSDATPQRIIDYHTVLNPRKVDGKPRKDPVVSHREYLCDAVYTVLLEVQEDALITCDDLIHAINNPVYTPFLGRRSCALSRPLYEETIDAVDFESAFSIIEPYSGTVYSESKPSVESTVLKMRDVPLYSRKRQFASRNVYLYQLNKTELENVSE